MNNVDKYNGLPNPLLESEDAITYEKLHDLMAFNTVRYWHCWFDPKTNRLYNQYCKLLLEDAFGYLLGIGLINDKKEQMDYFEYPEGYVQNVRS